MISFQESGRNIIDRVLIIRLLILMKYEGNTAQCVYFLQHITR